MARNGDARNIDIELCRKLFRMLRHVLPGGTDVFECSRPAAACIAHSPVFNIQGCDSALCQRRTQMAGVSEVVASAPVAAMDEHQQRCVFLVRRQAQFGKFRRPYREHYKPIPFSRKFVRHMEG